MSKKVISFSVFGTKPIYIAGMFRNIELSKTVYPGWEVFVYHDNSIPLLVQKKMSQMGAKLTNMDGSGIPGTMWRFLPHDDKEIDFFISRDSDFRLFSREKEAVEVWLQSGKTLHVMRDNPHHRDVILAGMFGLLHDDFRIKESILSYIEDNKERVTVKTFDQEFLKNIIYPLYKNDMYVHSSIYFLEDGANPFPSKIKDNRFVGEQIFSDESRVKQNAWATQQERRT